MFEQCRIKFLRTRDFLFKIQTYLFLRSQSISIAVSFALIFCSYDFFLLTLKYAIFEFDQLVIFNTIFKQVERDVYSI